MGVRQVSEMVVHEARALGAAFLASEDPFEDFEIPELVAAFRKSLRGKPAPTKAVSTPTESEQTPEEKEE